MSPSISAPRFVRSLQAGQQSGPLGTVINEPVRSSPTDSTCPAQAGVAWAMAARKMGRNHLKPGDIRQWAIVEVPTYATIKGVAWIESTATEEDSCYCITAALSSDEG